MTIRRILTLAALALALAALSLPGCKHRSANSPATPSPASAVAPSPRGEGGPPGRGEGLRPTTTAPAVPVIGLRRAHVFISGHVQGVGFRNFVQSHAQALDLIGWVRNLSDGRVEAVVEGPPEEVAKLLKLVHVGPDRAKVDKVETADEPPVAGEFKDFQQRP